jgi:hypothetical protein
MSRLRSEHWPRAALLCSASLLAALIIAAGLNGCGGSRDSASACGAGALPFGQRCGSFQAANTACGDDAPCGSWGRCVQEEDRCCGKTNACCSDDYGCCSGRCVDGVCASDREVCACDQDCNGASVCISGQCVQLPGTPCVGPNQCSEYECSADGVCPCADANDRGLPCRSTADCCSGKCISGQCLRAAEGGACQADVDCANGACAGGACRCLLPGAPALTGDVFNVGCCSGYVSAGVCATGSGTFCSDEQDCLGGPCVASACSCVGPGGVCDVDGQCCAGATSCHDETCQ